mgnify:CR=1 FL=1
MNNTFIRLIQEPHFTGDSPTYFPKSYSIFTSLLERYALLSKDRRMYIMIKPYIEFQI